MIMMIIGIIGEVGVMIGKMRGVMEKRGFSLIEVIIAFFILGISIEFIFLLVKAVSNNSRIIKTSWEIEDVATVMSEAVPGMPQNRSEYLRYLENSFGTSRDPWGNHYRIVVADYDASRLCDKNYQAPLTVIHPDGAAVDNVLFVVWTHPSPAPPGNLDVYERRRESVLLPSGSIYNVYTLDMYRPFACVKP